MRAEPQRAARLAEQALRLAGRIGDPHAEALALRHLGNAWLLQSRYIEALGALRRGLDAARALRHEMIEGSCLNGIGIALMRLGEFEGALVHLRAFLDMADRLKTPRARIIALTNVGSVCEELGDHAEAIRYNERAIEQSADDPDQACTARMNLGVLLALKRRFTAALPHYQEARAAMRRRGDRALESHLLANLGKTLYLDGQRDAGLGTLHEAEALARDVGAQAQLCLATMHLGHVHAHARRLPDARVALQDALALAQCIGERYYQRDLHRALAALYTLCHEPAQAALHARQYNRLDAAIYRGRADARAQALRLQLQVERERHHSEIVAARNAALERNNRRLREANATLQQRTRAHDRNGTVPSAEDVVPRLADDGAALRLDRASLHSLLTDRERAVLRLMSKGWTNAAIGRELSLSTYTVRDRVSTILAKLGVDSRAAAVALAVRAGHP